MSDGFLHVLFGAPGTGKTEALADIVVNVELTRGVALSDCLISSFTVDASNEIIQRTMTKLGIQDPEKIKEIKQKMWMGTIHSICFSFMREQGLAVKNVMGPLDFKIWAEKMGLEHKYDFGRSKIMTQQTILKYGYIEPQDTPAGVVLQAIEWVKHTHYNTVLTKLFQEFQDLIYDAPILQESTVKLDESRLPEYWWEYEKYKDGKGKIDYCDMLLYAYTKKFIPPTRVMFIDEFHDLSPLKYDIYKMWKSGHERTYVVGDDDQAIFAFLAASSKFLLKERDDADRVVILPHSFRLPSLILNIITRYIRREIRPEMREDKYIEPRAQGGIYRVVHQRNIAQAVNDSMVGTGFILCRTNYQVKEITKHLLSNQVYTTPYTYIRPDAMSFFSKDFVNLTNAVIKYEDQKTLSYDEFYALTTKLEKSMFKPGMITEFVKRPKNEYPFESIVKMFMSPMIVDELIQNLKLADFESFQIKKRHLQKKEIELPIKLRIGTIHSSKGLQADTVYLINNITNRIKRSMNQGQDKYEDEARVWYVGMSRAKERLFIMDDYFGTKRTFPIS